MKFKFLFIFSLVLLLISLSGNFYLYTGWQKSVEDPQAKVRQLAKEVYNRVTKLIYLPSEELPIIAEVSDLAKAKNDPFLARARLGDKLIIYQEANKVILYDPVLDKIRDVGTLNLPNLKDQAKNSNTQSNDALSTNEDKAIKK